MRVIVALAVLAAAAFGREGVVVTTRGQITSLRVTGVFREQLRGTTASGDHVALDWSEIETLEFQGPVAMRYGDGDRLSGRIVGLEHLGRTLVVQSSILGTVRLPISTLESAPDLWPKPLDSRQEAAAEAQAKTPLKPHDWKGKIVAAGVITAGKSDTLTASLSALIQRNFTDDHVEFAVRAVYGKSNGVENKNSQSVRALWRHYYDERLYSYLSPELGRDEIQRIDLFAFLNVGVGYSVWKEDDDRHLDIEGGLGYRHESYAGDDVARNDITGRGAVIYDDVLWDDVKLRQLVEVLVPLNEPASFLVRSETEFVVPLSEHLGFNSTVRVEYRAEPVDRAQALDLYVGVGLEYKF